MMPQLLQHRVRWNGRLRGDAGESAWFRIPVVAVVAALSCYSLIEKTHPCWGTSPPVSSAHVDAERRKMATWGGKTPRRRIYAGLAMVQLHLARADRLLRQQLQVVLAPSTCRGIRQGAGRQLRELQWGGLGQVGLIYTVRSQPRRGAVWSSGTGEIRLNEVSCVRKVQGATEKGERDGISGSVIRRVIHRPAAQINATSRREGGDEGEERQRGQWPAKKRKCPVKTGGGSANKHKPWIETEYQGIVMENDNTVLLNPPLFALDKDAPLHYAGEICGFRVHNGPGGSGAAQFEAVVLDRSTGEGLVRSKEPLDCESQREHSFTIQAYDCGEGPDGTNSKKSHNFMKGPGYSAPLGGAGFEARAGYTRFSVMVSHLSVTRDRIRDTMVGDHPGVHGELATVHVRVNDVNEFSPVFVERRYEASVPEGRLFDRIVRVEALDADCSPQYSQICFYDIITPNVPFAIDNDGENYTSHDSLGS
ncbi:hypothetical protein NFI96_010027 [Prochilodus magdalenae]|nr:hypothetical protein NFI96_010027 [Prochilodus magdalenae]